MRVAVAGTMGFASALPAQRSVSSVDLSGVGVWYADSIRSAGTSLSPAVRIDWTNATLGVSGTVSMLRGGGSSVQTMVEPAAFTRRYGSFSGELAASLGGSSHHDGTRTGQGLGVARMHVMRDDAGAWVGGGIGRTWDGDVWRNVRQAEVGAWTEREGVSALATVTPVAVADTIHYTDLQAAVRVPGRTIELGVTGGARVGATGAAVGGSSRAWGSVTATTWLAQRVALVASGGTYPVDLTQGYPGGRFVTVALRLTSRAARTVATPPPAEETSVVSGFETRAAGQGKRAFRVNAASARTVELSGDFTGWQTVRLTRGADGWWTIMLPVSAGTHQVNLRVDGGAWSAPPGLLTSRDEFGGVVGILRIE